MATRLADATLKLGCALLLGLLAFLVHRHGWEAKYWVLPVAILGLFGVLRLEANLRVNTSLLLLSLAGGAFLVEFALAVTEEPAWLQKSKPQNPFQWSEGFIAQRMTLPHQVGRSFDTRSRLKVMRDLRRQGIEAWPSIGPQVLFIGWPDAYQRSSITIKGQPILPLAGISDVATVYCNENGNYVIYNSDEHGFRNPKGLWSRATLDIVMIGDSYAHGACVEEAESFAGAIRSRYTSTLNLGSDGNGPLMELATLREYAAPFRPKIVLWFYFDMNDMGELEREQGSFLMKYLTPAFTQGLRTSQPDIDQALKAHVSRVAEGLQNRSVLPAFFERFRDPDRRSTELQRLLTLADVRARLEQFFPQIPHVRAQEDLSTSRQAPPHQEKDLALFARTLEEARKTVQGWGGTLVFVYLPEYKRYASQGWYSGDREAVLQIVEDSGISLIDLHPAFVAQSDPLELFPFRQDGHYNPAGHRLVAREVLTHLDRLSRL